MASKDMDKLVSHTKTSGFVYQGSEIYDGLANTWDMIPLGVEMKNNIKQLWWKRFIQECYHIMYRIKFSYFYESAEYGKRVGMLVDSLTL